MPRTKVSKNSKRNRDTANREERIRNFEMKLDVYQSNIANVASKYISDVESNLGQIISRLRSGLLQMKMSDFLELNLSKFSDYQQLDQTNLCAMPMASGEFSSRSICNSSSLLRSIKATNPNDEGYLTEDSNNGANGSSLAAISSMTYLHSTAQPRRTPGPLSSARARRHRRSRSACGEVLLTVPGSAIQPKPGALEHSSRNKLRTPMASRTKAFSADRTPMHKARSVSPQTPPMAFLRWPKPGEMALSKFGSPMVAQVMPDKCANVNIPIRNGVLSLRPKKLSQLQSELIEALDPETINQIKTLQDNLHMILNMAGKADKAGNK